MDKEKLIKWLEIACGELDGLVSFNDNNDNMFYSGQLFFAENLLIRLRNGLFDKEN